MKIYELFNSYDTEDFTENVKFSCHGWIIKCVENINLTPKIVFENSTWINKKDLVGKYNAPNFLLEVFSFYQSKRFRDYPKERDYIVDFSIILYCLLKNDADLTIKDYNGNNFIMNLVKVFNSQEDISWKKNHKFLNNNTFSLINEKEKIESINKIIGKSNKLLYLNIFLSLSLNKNEKIKNQFKL